MRSEAKANQSAGFVSLVSLRSIEKQAFADDFFVNRAALFKLGSQFQRRSGKECERSGRRSHVPNGAANLHVAFLRRGNTPAQNEKIKIAVLRGRSVGVTAEQNNFVRMNSLDDGEKIGFQPSRSEERRVGKECRSRWS